MTIPTPNGERGTVEVQNGKFITMKTPSDYKLTIAPGANTLIVSKPDGTVVSTEILPVSCESGTTWQATPSNSYHLEYPSSSTTQNL